jgi:hypothetical protein
MPYTVYDDHSGQEFDFIIDAETPEDAALQALERLGYILTEVAYADEDDDNDGSCVTDTAPMCHCGTRKGDNT